jgi:hypothetical protein
VQSRKGRRLLDLKLSPQGLTEQRVVAVPPSARPQGGDERVLALEPVERALTVALSGQRVRQLTADGRHQARLQQESPGPPGVARDHLPQEVVGHGPVGPTEVPRPGTWPPQEHGGEPQAGGPTFSSVEKLCHLTRMDGDAVPREELARLPCGEREVIGPNLGEVAADPQPVQHRRRLDASYQDDAQGGLVPDQPRDLLMHASAANVGDVVEHEDDLVRQPGEPRLDPTMERRAQAAHGVERR